MTAEAFLEYLGRALLVFGVALALDVLWALYIRRTATGAAGPAATYAAGIFIASAYNTLSYLQSPWLLVPMACGAWVGTYFVIRYEHHRQKETVCTQKISS